MPVTHVAVIGRFELDREVGRGTSGVVFAARDRDTGETVALKIFHETVDDQSLARFRREVLTASALDHAGVVRVLDHGVEGSRPFLVTELIGGESLRQRLDRPPPPAIAEIVDIGMQIAEVLVAAHAIELVHRDVKPANVMLGPQRVTMLDFGLAFMTASDDDVGRLTTSGVLGGTPSYMSPEQALADPLSPAADIYSFGTVLYEMCAGRPPFIGTVADVLARHMYMPAQPLAAVSSEVPDQLGALVMEMLEKRPESRPSASSVQRTLAEIAAGC